MQLVVKCLEWVYVLVLQHMQYTFLFITFNLCNVFFFLQCRRSTTIIFLWKYSLGLSTVSLYRRESNSPRSNLSWTERWIDDVDTSLQSVYVSWGYANYIFGDLSPRWLVRGENGWGFWTVWRWRWSTCLMFRWVGILWPLSGMSLRKADETAYDVIQTCLYEEKMYR